MTIRTDRLAEEIRNYASSAIMNMTQYADHPYGMITVSGVEITKDKSYADVYVNSSHDEDTLPKFIAPLARELHTSISRDFGMRKTPKIRFRIRKGNASSPTDILALIHSLDKQYGLSQDTH
jgi:ribosome-binding factor A